MVAAVIGIALCVSMVASASASAAATAPGWMITTDTYPTNLEPGHNDLIVLSFDNVGGAASKGPITVTDTLPKELTVLEAGYKSRAHGGPGWGCVVAGRVVTCTSNQINTPTVRPGVRAKIAIVVSVDPSATGSAENDVTVVGGGALAPASTSSQLVFGSSQPGFGFERLDGWSTNANGTIDTQAGSHPYELTVSFTLNNLPIGSPAGGPARDINVNLPPGLVGDVNALPQCTNEQLKNSECPLTSQVGIDRAALQPNLIAEGSWDTSEQLLETAFRVYNMVPPPGMPAQFGLDFQNILIFLDAGVRSGSDYGITEHASNLHAFLANTTTIWGTPADPSHNGQRCNEFPNEEPGGVGRCQEAFPRAPLIPLLTLPTSCEGPQTFTAEAVRWEDPSALPARASFVSHDGNGVPTGFTGCEHLGFGPAITVAPDTGFADTPAGLTVDVRVPQEGLLNPEGVVTSNIKNTTVTLPEGVVINPGQAAGLQACGPTEDGLTTDAEKAEGREDNGPAHCPNASRVGTDEIQTPLLKEPLQGNVYLLRGNPPNVRLLVTASGEGVNLKLVGNVRLDERTGRLTSTFRETPEVPFTDFKLAFSGGAQAALSTPLRCGSYSTESDFAPWTTPFVQDANPFSSFAITAGTAGAPCPPEPLPFSPAMIAGSTTDQAAGFTDFSLLLTRPDDQQRIQGLRFKTPEGLLGMISKIPLCPEAQADAGTCSSASQIGHTVVEAGPGPYPLVVPQPGQPPAPIYLTGPYEGAPYGLSIVVPLVVGPFMLQTQIVRARIEVDPITAQITVTTDPLPQIIDGVPADLRTINAVVDRPGFMFNPTDCRAMGFSGTAFSNEGAQASLESHFQMGSCQSLTFKPNFTVSVTGRTSRKSGAGLTAKIVYPNGTPANNQASSQSNVAMVKVNLPKQLPSRLPTLQKACTAVQFNKDPAGCPAASIVGHATAVTPVLPVPVSGPAYFVSYGGAKFPELVIVLQGYGVTVYLHGETFINEKTGITSSTFRQVPDVPITNFELKLPQGQYSALAANTNLCRLKKLVMPTSLTGHNGAVIHQNTPIAITGCPKARKPKHHK